MMVALPQPFLCYHSPVMLAMVRFCLAVELPELASFVLDAAVTLLFLSKILSLVRRLDWTYTQLEYNLLSTTSEQFPPSPE